MEYEKSCGAVIYRYFGDTIKFIAVKSKTGGHWGFPKGHVEDRESEQETAVREVLEETGLNITLCDGFRTAIKYSPAEGTIKEVVFFMGESLYGEVNIQQEEIMDYKWLDYSKAVELITFDDEKKVLTEVKEYEI